MGFLPFANQGGKKVVLWHRLVVIWIVFILGCVLGDGAFHYVRTGDFWQNSGFAIGFGVFLAMCFTVRCFLVPVDKLPPV
jgi:hypothetical protein